MPVTGILVFQDVTIFRDLRKDQEPHKLGISLWSSNSWRTTMRSPSEDLVWLVHLCVPQTCQKRPAQALIVSQGSQSFPPCNLAS